MFKHHALLLACCLALFASPACGARSSLDTYEDGLPSVVPLTGQGSDAPDAGDGDDDAGGDGDGDGDEDAIGDACSEDDCAGEGSECLESVDALRGLVSIEFPKGYCTRDCTDDADCPTGSSCFKGLGDGVCLRRCTTESQCRLEDGYTCGQIAVVGDGRDYCQPPFSLGSFPF